MRSTSHLKYISALCVMLALVLALPVFGCSVQELTGANANGDSEETAPNSREYMSQVNQTVEELSGKLQTFNDAVSREDVVGMQVQADAAFDVIDKLKDIEAPEELTELRQSYIDGCDQLKNALNDYVDLYVQIASANDAHPFDYAEYNAKIEQIQKDYSNGISTLESADKTATEL